MNRFLLSTVILTGVTTVAYSEEQSVEKQVTPFDYVTPKEVCGLKSVKRKIEFNKKHQVIEDLIRIEFTDDGGFTLYNEDGTNHIWELDAEQLRVTKRNLTAFLRDYRTYNFDTSPRNAGGNTASTYGDWTNAFADLLHEIVNQENFVVQSKDPISHIRIALNCVHKILINTVARGQERLLHGKTNTVTFK